MSEKKVTKIGIVGRIMAHLGLGDEGKIGKFFIKEIKKCNNAVKQLKHNQTGELSQFKIEEEKLNDKLEDAVEAVKDAYENVKPEDVATNAKMDAFSVVYWEGVKEANRNVKKIKDSLEILSKVFDEGGNYYANNTTVLSFEGKKFLKEQISMYEDRIKEIS